MYLRILSVIVCITLVSISVAEEKGDSKSAPKYSAPEGFLKSLPAATDIQARKPEDESVGTAGFGWYNNCRVNGSSRLLGSDGTTQISVYARDVDWNYSVTSPTVTSPSGDGGTAGSGWQFPNAHKFGVVIYQGGNYWNVTSTSSSSPTVISGISNTQPVLVTVNDTNGNYGDNGGAVDIYLRKDN